MELGKRSVLIVDQMHASLSNLLAKLGLEADYRPDMQRGEIIRQIKSHTGLIIRSKTPIDAEVLNQATRLRFIARAGSGLDLIDVKKAEGMGISVFNAPEGNRDAVAEHTLGMLLCLLHKIHLGNHQVRNMIWDREANRGMELKNKVVGIIGYGN
ncbi:MAG: NAD(P)-dependent oxidoreductase, partial [Bacteroidota bacterium]